MISIRPLDDRDVEPLVRLHTSSPEVYSQYFQPFPFTVLAIRQRLAAAREDCYFGVFFAQQLAGLYMLRGFDEGYAVPAYGVWIAQEFSGKGMARATLDHAVAVCKQRCAEKLMLKVHPDNVRAKRLYERYGFQQVSADSRNHNLVYELLLNQNISAIG